MCGEWLSVFEKPLYSNRVDIEAQEFEHPPTGSHIFCFLCFKKLI